jgi:HEAT repeat protein
MVSAVQQALAKLRRARSIDEGDDYADELAKAARQNLDEVIELYHTTESDTFALVWCLQGLTGDAVIELFTRALKHKDHQVRWAAIEGLKHSHQPSLIPVFIAALSDRAHMVKLVAVEWLTSHGDARAIAPLERLLKLRSMIKTSPGIVKEAQEAVSRLRASRPLC